VRTFWKTAAFAGLLLLGGCDYSGLLCYVQDCGAPAPPADSPGSYTLFSIVSFTNLSSFCLDSTDNFCNYDLSENLGTQLQGYSWNNDRTVTDGYINDSWTSPDLKETDVIGTTSNLLYVSSHGSISGSICLRYCNSGTGYDRDVEINDLPGAWHGPNWLVLDACSAVNPNANWARIFGGNLHGILGFNREGYGLTDAGQKKFTELIHGYSTAIDAWDAATALTSDAQNASALIPAANKSDAIEARGGPHFGYDGSTNPQYLSRAKGTLSTQPVSLLATAPSASYALVPEAMNESYWASYYGGSSVPSTTSHPSSNEDLYRNPYISVDHFLGSGGLEMISSSTGTARGFGESDAYQFALSWIDENGGLPPDAVLTYSGIESINPENEAPTSDEPNPSTRQYIFVWQHGSSGVVDGDKIQINVDDAGSLTTYTEEQDVYSQMCRCEVPKIHLWRSQPWVPVFHIHQYVRLWRSLGMQVANYSTSATAGIAGFGFCGSDMSEAQSVAVPCGVALNGDGASLVNLQSGVAFSSLYARI